MTTCRMAISMALVIGCATHARSQESATDPLDRSASSPDKITSADPLDSKPVSDVKPPAQSARKPKSEQATFGAGCFWHVEAVFERLKGVNSAVSGYAGGDVPYPSYEMVHEGTTGHAEVVMVDYDPEVISFEDLLKVFWKNHDPTSINRQGEDVGPQYRSVIFYHNDDQRKAALKSYKALTQARVFRSPIVTQLVPMRAFYRAEDYHQNYYGGKPRASSRRRKAPASTVKNARAKGTRAKPQADKSSAPPEESPAKPES